MSKSEKWRTREDTIDVLLVRWLALITTEPVIMFERESNVARIIRPTDDGDWP